VRVCVRVLRVRMRVRVRLSAHADARRRCLSIKERWEETESYLSSQNK